MYMQTYQDTFFIMIVILTANNFPDAILPAYEANRLYSLLFLAFLFLGVFLILNVLLAVIFNIFNENYKQDLRASDKIRT